MYISQQFHFRVFESPIASNQLNSKSPIAINFVVKVL